MIFGWLSKLLTGKQEPEKITYERVSHNEVRIIYKCGAICNEVIALVATKGTY